jgi:hypothetical protein
MFYIIIKINVSYILVYILLIFEQALYMNKYVEK